MDPDPEDPAVFVTFAMATKNYFVLLSFFAYYFLKLHFQNFSTIRSQRSHKTVGIKIFLTIFGAGAGSGSVSRTNGSGSATLLTVIRIQIHGLRLLQRFITYPELFLYQERYKVTFKSF